MFKRVCKAAQIGEDWTPRELRTDHGRAGTISSPPQ
jgi:hypothetical protein